MSETRPTLSAKRARPVVCRYSTPPQPGKTGRSPFRSSTFTGERASANAWLPDYQREAHVARRIHVGRIDDAVYLDRQVPPVGHDSGLEVVGVIESPVAVPPARGVVHGGVSFEIHVIGDGNLRIRLNRILLGQVQRDDTHGSARPEHALSLANKTDVGRSLEVLERTVQ